VFLDLFVRLLFLVSLARLRPPSNRLGLHSLLYRPRHVIDAPYLT